MRPPVVNGNNPPGAVLRRSVVCHGAGIRFGLPDLVSGSATGRGAAPNTYRGSRLMLSEPAGDSARDLETHQFPRAVPVKVMAERPEAFSSFAPGSVEGQDERDRIPGRRNFRGAERPSNQAEGLPGLRPSAMVVVEATCILAASSAPNGLTPLRLQSDGGLGRSLPITWPGTCSCRKPSAAGAYSRWRGPSCERGRRGPWTFRASAPGASCTSGPRGWRGGKGQRLPRRPT